MSMLFGGLHNTLILPNSFSTFFWPPVPHYTGLIALTAYVCSAPLGFVLTDGSIYIYIYIYKYMTGSIWICISRLYPPRKL